MDHETPSWLTQELKEACNGALQILKVRMLWKLRCGSMHIPTCFVVLEFD